MRHPLVTFVNVAQVLLGLLLAAISVYWVLLTFLPRFGEAEPLPAEGIRGLLIGSAVVGVPAIVTLIAAYGLWRARFWGWVLSLATDVGMFGLLVYSMLEATELALTVLTITFAVMIALLMLPPVRKYYWGATGPQKAET